VQFQFGGRPFSETGNSFILALRWSWLLSRNFRFRYAIAFSCVTVCCWTNWIEYRLQWDWLEATVHMKDVWKCITTVSGDQCVITNSLT